MPFVRGTKLSKRRQTRQGGEKILSGKLFPWVREGPPFDTSYPLPYEGPMRVRKWVIALGYVCFISSIVQAAPTCSVAMPFAWGERPHLTQDRVIFTRVDLITPRTAPHPDYEMGVYDFSYAQEFFPIFPTSFTQIYSDESAGISKDWVYWIRNYGGSSEIHLANVWPPYQHLVLDTAQHLGGTEIALTHLSGGNEFNPVDRNDFFLSWTKSSGSVATPQKTFHWCRLSDCVGSVIQTGWPGLNPGEEITQGVVSLTGGAGPQQPGIVYQVKRPMPTPFYAWESLWNGNSHLILGVANGPASPISEMVWSGLFHGYTREMGFAQSAVSLSLPMISYPAAIFTSSPPWDGSDHGISISKASSNEGEVLFGFTRTFQSQLTTSSSPSEVRIAFYGNGGISQDVPVPVVPSDWNECSEVSVFGNRVVMTCRNPNYLREIPILFESICHP